MWPLATRSAGFTGLISPERREGPQAPPVTGRRCRYQFSQLRVATFFLTFSMYVAPPP